MSIMFIYAMVVACFFRKRWRPPFWPFLHWYWLWTSLDKKLSEIRYGSNIWKCRYFQVDLSKLVPDMHKLVVKEEKTFYIACKIVLVLSPIYSPVRKKLFRSKISSECNLARFLLLRTYFFQWFDPITEYKIYIYGVLFSHIDTTSVCDWRFVFKIGRRTSLYFFVPW